MSIKFVIVVLVVSLPLTMKEIDLVIISSSVKGALV